MKTKLFIILIFVSFSQIWAVSTIHLSAPVTSTEILENTDSQLRIQYVISEINTFEQDTELGYFTNLDIPGFSYTTEQGLPKLPVQRKIISVPFGADVNVIIE